MPAHGAKDVAEHFRRQHTGIRVVAGAVITVEKHDITQPVDGAMGEFVMRKLLAMGGQNLIMGDLAQGEDGAEAR